MLDFTYTNAQGRTGRMSLNLDVLLPCNASSMKTLLSTVRLAANDEEIARAIYDNLSGRIDELKRDRDCLEPENDYDKKLIAKINASMKKLIANASALVKVYDFPEISDADAQISFKAATVYVCGYDKEKHCSTVKTFDGWNFERKGIQFSVCKQEKMYVVIHRETGLEVCKATNRNAAALEISKRAFELLENSEKMQDARNHFKTLMIAAGYMEAEQAENILNDNAANKENKQEVKKMSDYSFTSSTVTCKGKTFPAEYNVIDSGAVLVFVILGEKENGRKEKQRICFSPEHPDHAAALEAAKESNAGNGKQAKTISKGFKKFATPAENVIAKEKAAPAQAEKQEAPAAPVQVEKQEAPAALVQAEKQETPARDPKQARGPVPEKTFIGETIQGNGWRILFDGETARTRVIFDGAPSPAVKAALEKAGFYYSGKMNSWNKKLTFKAYRAANALAGELSKLYAA